MTGAPEGSPKVVFMWFYGFVLQQESNKPGIEPATPGLQGIALIHYTTGASLERSTYMGHETFSEIHLLKSVSFCRFKNIKNNSIYVLWYSIDILKK